MRGDTTFMAGDTEFEIAVLKQKLAKLEWENHTLRHQLGVHEDDLRYHATRPVQQLSIQPLPRIELQRGAWLKVTATPTPAHPFNIHVQAVASSSDPGSYFETGYYVDTLPGFGFTMGRLGELHKDFINTLAHHYSQKQKG